MPRKRIKMKNGADNKTKIKIREHQLDKFMNFETEYSGFTGNDYEFSPQFDLMKSLKEKLKSFKPKTDSQKTLCNLIDENIVTIGSGAAGTGKSYVALHKALDVMAHNPDVYHKVIIFHPLTQVDNDDLGYLPGNVDQKIDPYKQASMYTMSKILSEPIIKMLVEQKRVEFTPINYVRGMTFDNVILVLEEAQNTSRLQMKTLLTRLGDNTKFVITGDIKQSDKFKSDELKSGLYEASQILRGVENVGVMEFNENDVVRSRIVSNILKKYEEKEIREEKEKYTVEENNNNRNKKRMLLD